MFPTSSITPKNTLQTVQIKIRSHQDLHGFHQFFHSITPSKLSRVYISGTQTTYKHNYERKIVMVFYQSVLKYVLGAQKNRLIETVYLSTNNTCFG